MSEKKCNYLVTFENYMGDHSKEMDRLITSTEPLDVDKIIEIAETYYKGYKIMSIQVLIPIQKEI